MIYLNERGLEMDVFISNQFNNTPGSAYSNNAAFTYMAQFNASQLVLNKRIH